MDTPNSSPNSTPIFMPIVSNPLPPMFHLNTTIIPSKPIQVSTVTTELKTSKDVLDYLFRDENIKAKDDLRCSSLNYFNNQAFGKKTIEQSVDEWIDNPEHPIFKRLNLADLSKILPECIGFRFVVLKTDGKINILFAQGAGPIPKGSAMSHSQLACGKEVSSECVAAGEIHFVKEDEQWQINKISNQTGHFRASIETLIAPLTLLKEQTLFSFSNQFVLELYSQPDKSDAIKVDLADFQARVNAVNTVTTTDEHFTAMNTVVKQEVLLTTTALCGTNLVVNDDQQLVQLSTTAVINPPLQPVINGQRFTLDTTPTLLTTNSMFNHKSSLPAAVDKQEIEEDMELPGKNFSPRSRH